MGTNFYLEVIGEEDTIHIGKSSAGWVFALNTHPDRGIRSLDDWQRLWADPMTTIRDEYGRALTPPQMLDQILNRQAHSPDINPVRNPERRGPNNLIRHRLVDIVAYGDGTYDILCGEFC